MILELIRVAIVMSRPRSQDFCLGGAKPQDNFSDSVARSLRSHNASSPLSTLDKNYISPRMLISAIVHENLLSIFQ